MQNRYYRNSKLSEYLFLKILRSYAEDRSASELAKSTRTSIKTIRNTYKVFQTFFVGVGLFNDLLLADADYDDDPAFLKMQYLMLDFHLARLKRLGHRYGRQEKDLHYLESSWRFEIQFALPDENQKFLPDIIFTDMKRLIEIAGPLGGPIQNKIEALTYIAGLIDRKLAWLSRSVPDFQTDARRAAIQDIQEIDVNDSRSGE